MSDSESMIERVARAICGENQGDPDMVIGSVMGDREAWTDFIPEARAAIEAMREPTEAMLDTQAMRGDPEDTKWVYQQMIAAALGEDHP